MTENEKVAQKLEKLKELDELSEQEIMKVMEQVPRIRACQHRWVEGDNKERPAYRCTRCNSWRFVP